MEKEKNKWNLKELVNVENLPEDFIALTNVDTKRKDLFGIQINYSVKQVVKAGLKTGGYATKEKWIGSYANSVRTEYYQPEQTIIGLALECVEKSVHGRLILHRMKVLLDKLVAENPLEDK